MRSLRDWDSFKYFSPNSMVDNWGDPIKMDYILIAKLDDLRDYLKMPIIVTSGFRPGNTKSQHAMGKAVDIIVPDFRKPLIDLFIEAGRFGFTGIGMYDDWKYHSKVVGGLHLDVRESEEARWIGHRNSNGRNQYFPLDSEHLKWFRMI